MSELLPEEQGFARLRSDGNEYEATPSNTTVFTHLGRLALYDRVCVRGEPEKDLYVWSYHPNFEGIRDLALQTNCQKVLNMRRVPEAVENMYVKHATKDLGDTMPEEWINE